MKFISALVLLCSLPVFLFSTQINDYSIVDIPKELKKNADGIVRFEENTIRVKSKREAIYKVKYVVTIFNKKSDLNEFYVSYTKGTPITGLSGNLYDANGKRIRKLKKDDFSDHSAVSDFSIYEDDKVKYAEIRHHEYPYTIEFEYEQSVSLLDLSWQILGGFHTSIEKAIHQITTPNDISFHFKARNIELQPEKNDDGSHTTYTWKVENYKALEEEYYAPDDIFPSLMVIPNEFDYGGYEGKMDTWKAYGQFYRELNIGHNNLSEEMKKEIHQLTAKATTNEEKIAILYNYLQKEMRYVSVQLGIGGWQSFDAQYVEKNRYGDCKALTFFMKSMLEEVDIPAYPALINSNDDYIFQHSQDFVIPAFNHVILYVPNEDDPIWLECTSSYLPMGYISSSNENRKALIVKEDGGELIETPYKGASEHKQVHTITANVQEDGGMVVNFKKELYNDQHDFWRFAYYILSKEEQEKRIQKGLELPTFFIHKYDLTIAEQKPKATIDLELKIVKYASKAGKRYFLMPNMANRFDKGLMEMPDRKYRIERQSGFADYDTVRYILPPTMIVENIPTEKVELETDFGKYKITVTHEGNELIYTRYLEMNAFSYPKEQYDDYRAFYNAVVKHDKMKVVLLKKQP